MSPDRVRIFLRECRLDLRVGIYPSEVVAQPVLISVECEAALTQRFDDPAAKDMSQIMDYGRIFKFVHDELPRMGHIYLLESVAELIATFCLQDKRMESVRVRIEKTSAFPATAGAGVELTRTRS